MLETQIGSCKGVHNLCQIKRLDIAPQPAHTCTDIQSITEYPI